jgi:hypothetical protein
MKCPWCSDSDLDPDRFEDAVRQALVSGRVRRKRLLDGLPDLSQRGRRRLSEALEKVRAS